MPQMLLDFQPETSFDLEDYLPLQSHNESNKAFALVVQGQGMGAVFHGSEGVGKTHFINALYHQLKEAEVEGLLFLDCTDENWGIGAVTQYQYAVVDNLDQASPEQQTELFHLYNHIRTAGGFYFLASSENINQLNLLPDLRSRLLTLFQVYLESPTDQDLKMILVKLAFDRQLSLDETVLEYLLKRADRNIKNLRDMIQRPDQLSLQEKRKITVPLARQLFDAS